MPIKNGKNILGNAIIVYNILNSVYVISNYFIKVSCNACGLLNAYILANTTIDNKNNIKNLIGPFL
jgi:hypothetical protein